MYRVSGKQILLLTLGSGLVAALIFAAVQKSFNTNGGNPVETVVIADPSVATEEQNNVEVYRKVGPGVVNITSRGYEQGWFGPQPSEGTGSGSIIDRDGHILTNFHVIQNAQELEVQIENSKFDARIVGTDRDNDLAIIKVNAPADKLTPVELGTSKGLQVGQKVLAIGNPFGLQRTLTTGIISGLERPLRDPVSRRVIEGAIQTDASINPGNSGGPLLNTRGQLIGINTMIYSPSGGSVGIGFAVPVDTASKIIPDLIAKGYVPRPWMGVTILGPLNARLARRLGLNGSQGLIVGDVHPRTGAAAAGIRPSVVVDDVFGRTSLQRVGDVIVSIDQQKIVNQDDLQAALKDKKAGQMIQVEVLRQDRVLTVPIRLSETPREMLR